MLSIYFGRENTYILPGNSQFREIKINTLEKSLENLSTYKGYEPQNHYYELNNRILDKESVLIQLINNYYDLEQFIVARPSFGWPYERGRYWKDNLNPNEISVILEETLNIEFCRDVSVIFAKYINGQWVASYAIVFVSGMYKSDGIGVDFYHDENIYGHPHRDLNEAILHGPYIIRPYQCSVVCTMDELFSLIPISTNDLSQTGLFPSGFYHNQIPETFFIKKINKILPLSNIIKDFLTSCYEEWNQLYSLDYYLSNFNNSIELDFEFHSKWNRGAYFFGEYKVKVNLSTLVTETTCLNKDFSPR